MTKNVTSFGRSGLHDWFIQRISAIVIAAYMVYWIAFALKLSTPLDYPLWSQTLAQPWLKVFSLFTLIAIALHAWIGMWTVTTDYLKNLVLRIFVQVAIILTLLACVVWGLFIFWGFK